VEDKPNLSYLQRVGTGRLSRITLAAGLAVSGTDVQSFIHRLAETGEIKQIIAVTAPYTYDKGNLTIQGF
jgi:hypothetical protein